MGHSVSDAAAESVKKSEKKVKKILTDEERLRDLRNNVAAGLYTPLTEVRLLLEKYDDLLRQKEDFWGSRVKVVANAETSDGVRDTVSSPIFDSDVPPSAPVVSGISDPPTGV